MNTIDIAIGQSAEVEGQMITAIYPINQIDKCHGCHFDNVHTEKCTKPKGLNCMNPDRIFKLKPNN